MRTTETRAKGSSIVGLLLIAACGRSANAQPLPGATVLVPDFRVSYDGGQSIGVAEDTEVTLQNTSNDNIIVKTEYWSQRGKAMGGPALPLLPHQTLVFRISQLLSGDWNLNPSVQGQVDYCRSSSWYRFGNPDSFDAGSVQSVYSTPALSSAERQSLWDTLDSTTDDRGCGQAVDGVFQTPLRGFLTIDVVNFCTRNFPDTSSYYRNDAIGTTRPTPANVLVASARSLGSGVGTVLPVEIVQFDPTLDWRRVDTFYDGSVSFENPSLIAEPGPLHSGSGVNPNWPFGYQFIGDGRKPNPGRPRSLYLLSPSGSVSAGATANMRALVFPVLGSACGGFDCTLDLVARPAGATTGGQVLGTARVDVFSGEANWTVTIPASFHGDYDFFAVVNGTCLQCEGVPDGQPGFHCTTRHVTVPVVGSAGLIADSVGDFALVQGQRGWQYGYYGTTGNPSTFTRLTSFFTDPATVWGTHWSEASNKPPWTAISALASHPNKPGTGAEHWAVRRWTSTIDGAVTISGSFAMAFGNCGDGSHVELFVDGISRFARDISYPDTTGGTYSVQVTLHNGSIVDLATSPRANDGCDTTVFTARVEQAVATVVSISANPSTITAGQSSTLSWTSTGGTSAAIDQGIGSVSASGTRQVSPTQTTTYTLTVTGPGGTATASATVIVQAVQVGLTIASINPASGPTAGGTAVAITGTGFKAGATVRLGGVTATNIAFVSGTTLTAVTPPHGAGPVDVDIVNPDNQSARLAKGFSYQDSPATLTIQSVTPNYGPRTGGTSVTIKGTAFQAPATVFFGTSSYPATFVTVVNSTTITAKTPVHGAGNVDVTVSCGGSNAKLASGFRYTDVTTHIDSVDAPVGKAGDQVTISGVGFTPGILVKFNGASAGDVSVQSSTTIKCRVPAGSGRAIPVTVAGSDNNGYFTYVGGGASNASLTAVIPSSGQLNGGSSVTITGAGFQAGASVYFGANQATSVNIVDSTKITATVPALPAARMALALATGEPQTASVVVVNPDSSAAGGSSAFTYAPPGGGCVTSGLTQCLSGNRFTVQVAWKNPYDGGSIGVGHPIQLTSDTGSFWFFSDQNTELMVKVLDGSTVNGYFWVFYGALSDVEYTVTVTDTATGIAKSYHNPARNLGSVADTRAFFVGNRPAEAEAEADAGPSISPLLLERTETRLRAEATERAETIAALATTCLPNDLAHCLSGGRFRVSATWRNPYDGGTTGVGHAVQLTADTGYFWFFADSNVELVVKVLDGTSTNGRYWVFYGALSDVEYTITVTDTLSGAVKTYYNPPQHLGSVADTAAF